MRTPFPYAKGHIQILSDFETVIAIFIYMQVISVLSVYIS